jgi:hypothetical protein
MSLEVNQDKINFILSKGKNKEINKSYYSDPFNPRTKSYQEKH